MKYLKKLFAGVLAAAYLCGAHVQAAPVTTQDDTHKSVPSEVDDTEDAVVMHKHTKRLIVAGSELDTSALPFSAYEVGGDDVFDLMVPLRAVCEALGYIVSWDEETGLITVDDGTKLMKLSDGCMEVELVGKFNDRSLDGKLPLAFPVRIHDGYTYIPLSLTKCLFLQTMFYGDDIILRRERS